jgi:hypothetical protein
VKQITPDDIMDLRAYAKSRPEKRRQIIETKAKRRVALGPDAMAFFENYETMWHQVHEMLYIEQGVNMDRPLEPDAIADQLKDELAAYNPLIPNGAELVATIMIEVENPARRDALLDSLGGIEDCFVITLDKHEIRGIREEDTDRTNAFSASRTNA